MREQGLSIPFQSAPIAALTRSFLWNRFAHQVNQTMALRSLAASNPMDRVSTLAIGIVARVCEPVSLILIIIRGLVIYDLGPATVRTTTSARSEETMKVAVCGDWVVIFEAIVAWCGMTTDGVQEEELVSATRCPHFAL